MGALPERIALESRITVLLLKDVNAALRCREMSRPAAMLVLPLIERPCRVHDARATSRLTAAC
jgi:hypothetical protein